jgi:hypothetical protein
MLEKGLILITSNKSLCTINLKANRRYTSAFRNINPIASQQTNENMMFSNSRQLTLLIFKKDKN